MRSRSAPSPAVVPRAPSPARGEGCGWMESEWNRLTLSPRGRGWPATDAFTSRGGPGEGIGNTLPRLLSDVLSQPAKRPGDAGAPGPASWSRRAGKAAASCRTPEPRLPYAGYLTTRREPRTSETEVRPT